MTNNTTNPLFETQREKSGSRTFEKYRYQYHWALLHSLEKFSLKLDHAVFIELHEDIVSIDDISSTPFKFDYYQVKCLTDKKLSTKNIAIDSKNGSTIFSKILDNYKNNTLKPNINSLNLVSQSGFNFKQLKSQIISNKITIEDISYEDRVIFENCINQTGEKIPLHIFNFITPTLQEKNQNPQVIGQISTTLNNLYPKKNFNPCSIYNVLINSLYEKGCITIDYKNWNDAILNKSLTSKEIRQVIHTFLDDPYHKSILENCDNILDELNLKSIKRLKIKRKISDLIIELYNPNSTSLEISKIIKPMVLKIIDEGVDDISKIIYSIETQLRNEKNSQLIDSEEELTAHVIIYILEHPGIQI